MNNSFIEKWLDFREEELSNLSFDDKKHLVYFDEHIENILSRITDDDKEFVNAELTKLDNEFADYNSHWNRKYYKTGFVDAIKILLFCMK